MSKFEKGKRYAVKKPNGIRDGFVVVTSMTRNRVRLLWMPYGKALVETIQINDNGNEYVVLSTAEARPRTVVSTDI